MRRGEKIINCEAILSNRRGHWCDWCGEEIRKGGESVTFTVARPDRKSSPKRKWFHPECYAAFLAKTEAAEKGEDDYTWEPGEHPRANQQKYVTQMYSYLAMKALKIDAVSMRNKRISKAITQFHARKKELAKQIEKLQEA